jgi:hypothetical protein
LPKFVVNCGKEIYNQHQDDADEPFSVDLQSVIDSLEGDRDNSYYSTEQECSKAGFSGYKSILLVPMHLSLKKNTGVFIAHSKTTEGAYDHFIFPLDALSDNLTFYMKSNGLHHRDTELNALYNEILNNNAIDETEIIESITSEFKKWFPGDEIYVLLVNPLNMDEYILAADKNGSIPSFRRNPHLSDSDFISIAGTTLPVMKKEGRLVPLHR